MTPGFLISFGGLMLVVVLSLVVEYLLFGRGRTPRQVSSPNADVIASLERAEIAVREIEAELVSVRQHLRAG